MSEAKHTAGPWGFCKPNKLWLVYPTSALNDGIDYFIAEAINVDGREQEAKANARLIAAAPELLESLKETLDQLLPFAEDGDQPAITAAIKKARAALAKAEPRS